MERRLHTRDFAFVETVGAPEQPVLVPLDARHAQLLVAFVDVGATLG